MISAECRWIQNALAVQWNPQPLPAQVDWAEVDRLARHEGVAPLLYALRETHNAPSRVLQNWRDTYALTAQRAMLFSHELANIVTTLAAANIPHILLKGSALANTLYANVATRPMRDIDLLLHRADVPTVIELLRENGYTPDAEPHTGATLHFENEWMLRKQSLFEIQLELHWHLLDAPFYQQQVSLDYFWQAQTPFLLEGQTASMFAPTAQLLHLCAHAALHHQGELLWLNDIALLLQQHTFDWEKVVAVAKEHALLMPVQQVVGMLCAEWGVEISAENQHMLQAAGATSAENRIVTTLQQPNRSVIQRIADDVRDLPTIYDKIRYLALRLLPSPAYMRQRYTVQTDWLLPFYYLLHVVSGGWYFLRERIK